MVEGGFNRRCKKKNFKKERSLALGNTKCMQFVRAIKEGKGPVRRKGGLRRVEE